MNFTGRGTALGLCVLAGLAAGCSSGSNREKVATRPTEAIVLDQTAAHALRDRAARAIADSVRANDPRVRANAMEAAGVMPESGLQVLRDGLADPNIAVRTVAAMTVGKRRLTSLVDAVRPLLAESSPFVSSAAIYATIQCGQEVDRTPLARLLTSDPSTRVRSHVAFILGELGDPSALPLLRQSLHKHPIRASQVEVNLFQLQAAEAMVKLGDETQLAPLRAALYPSRPEDLELTALAVQILGEVQDRGSIDQLIYLSATKDPTGQKMPAEVRLAIASSLARMGLRQGDFIADEFIRDAKPEIRAQVAFVYGETATPANLGVLDGMLGDRDGAVRLSAATAIVKIAHRAGEPQALPEGRAADLRSDP